MARSMERFGPAGHADNTVVTLLTTPSGHKYEILELWIVLLGANGSASAFYIDPGTGPQFTTLHLNNAGADAFLNHDVLNALPLYAGEQLKGAAFANGGNWVAYGTYIDVDLTA